MPSNSKEYAKDYYAKHKSNLSGKQSKQIRCECCDKHLSKWNLAKHNKTSKHILHSSPSPKDILSELEIIKLELRELKEKVKDEKETEEKTLCLPCNEELLTVDLKQHQQSKLHKTNINLDKL